jgi:hypothetical protein
LSRVALGPQSSCLCLLSSWDCKHKPSCLCLFFLWTNTLQQNPTSLKCYHGASKSMGFDRIQLEQVCGFLCSTTVAHIGFFIINWTIFNYIINKHFNIRIMNIYIY